MTLYTIKDDIVNDKGILLLRKDLIINEKVLGRLKELTNSISIDSENMEVHNEVKTKDYNSITKTSTTEIIQSFEERKHITDKRILERPNKVLSNIIFETKTEPWSIYINALFNYASWLYAHSIDVSMMSLLMAVELGYEDSQLYNIGLGALLHDIGMLLIPKYIIEKPEPLNETERLIFYNHCELGVSSLELFNLPKECTDVILQHHERLDGSGYPKGLKENEICLNSRIVMIAELIDTITSDGPNRKNAYKMDEAIKFVKEEEKVSLELISLLEKMMYN